MIAFNPNPNVCLQKPGIMAFSQRCLCLKVMSKCFSKHAGVCRAEFEGGCSVSLWAGQTHITHLPGKVPPPSLQSQQCEAFCLVKRWELRSPPSWQAERQIRVLVTLSAPGGLQLPLAKHQHFLWGRAPSVFDLDFHHPSLPPWSGLVLSPHDVSGWGRSQECP